MTPPDAMVNAPVEERHRREAARVVNELNPEYVEYWVLSGTWREPRHKVHAEFMMDRHAQSLANLEAAVRREYEGLVDAARMLKARVDTDHVATASDCCDLFIELETLKNA